MSEAEIKKQLAEALHDALAQHMIGTMLAAQGLLTELRAREADAQRDAERLVDLLQAANRDLGHLILALDGGRKR